MIFRDDLRLGRSTLWKVLDFISKLLQWELRKNTQIDTYHWYAIVGGAYLVVIYNRTLLAFHVSMSPSRCVAVVKIVGINVDNNGFSNVIITEFVILPFSRDQPRSFLSKLCMNCIKFCNLWVAIIWWAMVCCETSICERTVTEVTLHVRLLKRVKSRVFHDV